MIIYSTKEMARFLCHKRHPKVKDAAKFAGISNTTIANWRRRKSDASLNSVIKLADFFGYDLHLVKRKV